MDALYIRQDILFQILKKALSFRRMLKGSRLYKLLCTTQGDLREMVLGKYVINSKSHIQACMIQMSVFKRKAQWGQMAPKKKKGQFYSPPS